MRCFLVDLAAILDGLLDAALERIGLAPAATVFRPSLKMASARTVAVVVPSPATSQVLEATSRTIWAPMFSMRVLQLDFLGDGDAVFGDGGRAEGFFEDDVAALGAERDFDRVGEMLTPRRIAWRDSSP